MQALRQPQRLRRLPANSVRVLMIAVTSLLLAGGGLANSSRAWACSTSGQSASGYNYSSQLTSTAIVVCNATASSKTQPGSATTSATASKPTVVCTTTKQTIFSGPPAFTTRQANVTVCGTSVYVKNVAPPPPPTAKTVNTPATSATTSAAAQSSFSPDPIGLVADKAVVEPGKPVQLDAIAAVHFRTGSILGQAVTVRFTPAFISWNFGAGPEPLADFATAGSQTHRFDLTGSQVVLATVRFEAAYRFAGQTAWTTETGYLAQSASVNLIVARVAAPSQAVAVKPIPKPRIRLVAKDCIANPSGKGCP